MESSNLPFETLKRVRRRARDQARLRLNQHRRDLQRIRGELNQLNEKKESLYSLQMESLEKGPEPGEMVQHEHFREQLSEQIDRRYEEVEKQKAEVESAREELIEKMKNLRLVEKLEQRKRQQRLEDVQRRRQKAMDEAARNQQMRETHEEL